MPTLTKTSSIVKTIDAQSVKVAIEINETNIDDIISHYNTNAVETDDTDVSGCDWVLDENNLGSDSDEKLATQQSIKKYVDDSIPSGVIVMWSGSIATIPSGWSLCDGSGETPDLRDKFVLGAYSDAGTAPKVDDTGGSKTITANNLPEHTHASGTLATASDGAHDHDFEIENTSTGLGGQYAPSASGTDGGYTSTVAIASAGAHTHNITGSTAVNTTTAADYMPVYYALAFIQKD